MAKIVDIVEEDFTRNLNGYHSYFDGFVITLDDDSKICLGISNSTQCCENWGYFMTNDSTWDFIDAEVLDVKVVDEILNVERVADTYEGSTMFVNIETSVGTLQFTAYNEHNGYYIHEAVVIYKDKTQSAYL